MSDKKPQKDIAGVKSFASGGIAKPSITISNPADDWEANQGSKVNINWDYTGRIFNVKIEVYINNDLFEVVSSDFDASTKAYWWNVPEDFLPVEEKFIRIKITNVTDPLIYDFSDYGTIHLSGD